MSSEGEENDQEEMGEVGDKVRRKFYTYELLQYFLFMFY